MKLKRYLLGIIGLLVLVAIDQFTKYGAILYLKGKTAKKIISGIFELQYLENHGAAFGILQNQRWFLLVITVLILGAIAYLYTRLPNGKRYFPLRFTALLVAAGAVGNMADRIINGYVVDFFYFSLIDFPIFNVADCYVVVAACIAIVLIGFYYKDEDFEKITILPKKTPKAK